MTRKERKRDELIALAVKLIEHLLIVQHSLPATILEARGFGSVPRGKPNPHDLDIVLLYDMTEAQKADWAWFESIFGSLHAIEMIRDQELKTRASVGNDLLRRTLTKYLDEDHLPEALDRSEVKEVAERIQLRVLWAKCYSATDYRQSGVFIPHVETVLKKLIAGPFQKHGLQVHFATKHDLDATTGHILGLGLVKNPRKVWSPDIALTEIPRRFNMNENELRVWLYAELNNFSEQQTVLWSELNKPLKELESVAAKKQIHLPVDKVLSFSPIQTAESLSITELQLRCENAREIIRLMNQVVFFLWLIDGTLTAEEVKDRVTLTQRMLESFRTSELTEESVRKFMDKIGLPEGDFIILHNNGPERVIHETSAKIREELVAENNRWKKARTLQQYIRELLPFKKKLANLRIIPFYSEEVHLTEGCSIEKFGQRFNLWIYYDCPKVEFARLKEGLIDADWEIKIEDTEEYHEIVKSVELNLDEAMTAIREKMIKALAPFEIQTNIKKVER